MGHPPPLDRGSWELVIKIFNEKKTARRLAQFIKQEKPYFENRIDPLDLFQSNIVIPKKNNSRIAAQSGAFVIFGLPYSGTEKIVDWKKQLQAADGALGEIEELNIPSKAKAHLMGQLSTIGIDEYTVFPELQSIAKSLKRRYQLGGVP